ncbi:MAG TPA: outer membrane beta-barrel protein [Burkholderiales bacterium]|nr:outer membrane beta-barrel protein [Burkholderiales bacterium]
MRHLLHLATCLLLSAYAVGAAAQNSPPRAGKWEFTLQPSFTHSKSFDSGNGTSGTTSSSLGFGFGVAYNLNNNLALGGDFVWGSASYTANIVPAAGGATQTLNGTLDTSTIRFNVIWNMIGKGDITPFAIAGIGSTYVDTNIPYGGPPVCWYDPWWGYYCSQPTRTAYDVSYSGALGVRWDIDRNIFLRGLVNRIWLDVGGSIGQPYFDQYRVDLGFKF